MEDILIQEIIIFTSKITYVPTVIVADKEERTVQSTE